jgi:hypothetical protein
MSQQNKFGKNHILRHTGDPGQVVGIKDYILNSGKAKGVRAFDIRNGSGLEFTILADRCLDIAGLYFKGVNCSYLSRSGIVAPEFFEPEGSGFLRSFFAGFLTTCGLRNVGAPCEVDGEKFGIHGRISNTPAEEISSYCSWDNDTPVITVNGKMREARLFGENLILHRTISCKAGENKISIHNTVENAGFKSEPLMLLFHFNLGYPLLDNEAKLITPTIKLLPRDEIAEKGKDCYGSFEDPVPGYAEQVFGHELRGNQEGKKRVSLVNPNLPLALSLEFNMNQLPEFHQWKQMGEGDYVLGLEPANCSVLGRAAALESQKVSIIEPGETMHFDIGVYITESPGN